MRLRIMALAIVTAPKIGIAQPLAGLYVGIEAGHHLLVLTGRGVRERQNRRVEIIIR
jgi:hypothetical protein